MLSEFSELVYYFTFGRKNENTMIMSVMERRREIGVMKAIGATTADILTQVLEESAMLSLIGAPPY